jgi:hypothetical protein
MVFRHRAYVYDIRHMLFVEYTVYSYVLYSVQSIRTVYIYSTIHRYIYRTEDQTDIFIYLRVE